jgi:hypothetical protein
MKERRMRVTDEELWLQQKAELSADDTGKAFLQFLEDWVGTADRALDLQPDLPPADAFRESLTLVEGRQGRIACAFVGQMVVVAVSHWVHGEVLAQNLTAIERRLMEDTVLLKLAELEENAAATPQEEVPLLQD